MTNTENQAGAKTISANVLGEFVVIQITFDSHKLGVGIYVEDARKLAKDIMEAADEAEQGESAK